MSLAASRWMVALLTVLTFSCAAPLVTHRAVAEEPKDVNGWASARWGMTNEAILETFPGQAKRLEKRDQYKGTPPAYAEVGIEDFEILGQRYKIRFQMDQETDRLISILIQFQDTKNAGARVHFSSLEKALTEKYGRAIYRDEKETPDRRIGGVLLEGSATWSAMWKFPSTVIELRYLELRSIKLHHLTVKYEKAGGGAAGKL